LENTRLSDNVEKQDDSVFKRALDEILSRTMAISGCQSVSIRLQENGDFPFYAHEGLPDFFVLKENSLFLRDENDQLIYDQDGSQLLGCMCGNVIRGHFDRSFPFFSRKGSFWTNSTTLLLSSMTEEQKKFVGPTRNLCNYSGYESVALIPLKNDGNVFGLVHLADPRENMFSVEKIVELELVAEKSAAIIKRANEIIEKLLSMDRMISASED
jgi:GAF domain-containing protein